MSSDETQNQFDDEITLKELILKIKEFWDELWKHWLLIALICIPFVLFKLYKAWSTPVVYPATLTFMVDQDEGNSMGGMASILGQFGLGSMRSGKHNLDKILEISKSRRVLQMALFSRFTVKDKEDFLANHFLAFHGYDKKWRKDTSGLRDFRFDHGRIEDFTYTEKKAFKSVKGLLTGSKKKPGIYSTSYDENTGIMKLALESRQQDLSISFIDTLFYKLTNYYVEKSTEKAQSSFDVIKNKTDSLAADLASAEYNLANFMDRNQNVYSARQGTLKRTRLSANVQRLQIMHGEALKNLQFAEIALKNNTPFIALIDPPMAPLRPIMVSKLMNVIIGIIIGVLIGATFVILRKIYRDTMVEDAVA